MDEVIYAVGHYMAAVAEQLLRSGIAITDVGAFALVVDERDGEILIEDDVCGQVGLALSVQAKISRSPAEATLEWDAVSGWRLFRASAKDSPEGEVRWLGRGLVPEPGRVESFILAGQMDFSTVGSDEEPAYRLADWDYTMLLARLEPYIKEPEHVVLGWQERWRSVRSAMYAGRLVDALLTDRPDPVTAIALRASEVRALQIVLECAEAAMGLAGTGVVDGLASDLANRAADPSGAEAHRRGWRAARAARAHSGVKAPSTRAWFEPSPAVRST